MVLNLPVTYRSSRGRSLKNSKFLCLPFYNPVGEKGQRMCFITSVLESLQSKLQDAVAVVSDAPQDRFSVCGAWPGVEGRRMGTPGDPQGPWAGRRACLAA